MGDETDVQTAPLQSEPPSSTDQHTTVLPTQANSDQLLRVTPTGSSHDVAEMSHKSKVLRSVLLYAGFIFLGMMMAVLGPTLLDLQYISASTTEQIAFVITGRSIGILCGCLLSTVLMRYLDPWLTLGVCNVVVGAATISLPLCYNVYVLIAVSVVQGIGGGQYDAGGNVCLLFIWHAENGPWMQALHLFYGVGTILGPLLAEPFLVETADIDTLNTTVNSINHSMETFNTSGLENSSVGSLNALKAEESRIFVPYGIIGSVEVLIGLVFLVVFVRDGLHVRARKSSPEESSPHSKEALRKLRNMRILMIVVIFLFYSVYCTVESEMGNFLLLFCVNFLGWTKSNGAWITAAFWTTFTLSRLVGVFLVKLLKPQTIIFADITIALCGVIPLVIFLDYHPAVMWVCSLTVGAGMATIYATGITWTEQYMKVTETIGSVFVIGGALSDMYGPILLVYLMEHVHYMAFIYVVLAMTCSLLIIMIVLQLLANQYAKWKKEMEESAEKPEEEEPMRDMVMEVKA